MKRLLTLGLMICAIGIFAGRAVAADNAGQADLDKATEKKLSAVSVEDLGEVIDLCESAMKKGLDPSNTQFRQRFVHQHALATCHVLHAVRLRARTRPRSGRVVASPAIGPLRSRKSRQPKMRRWALPI